jgi:hypothetical protein
VKPVRNMNSASNRSLLPGVLLVVIGLVILLTTTARVGGRLIPGAIGVCFLAAYAYQRRYGYLVAGSILTGLGAGVVFDSSLGGNGAAVVSGLGFGFVTVFAVDSLRGLHRSHWWPLIPGTVLLLVGLEIATRNETMLSWLANWWPLAVIIAGVLAIIRAASRPRHTSS